MEQLADGWTAHQAPSGHTYYYNAATKKSTYQKPLRQSLLPTPPPPLPSQETPAATDLIAASSDAQSFNLATSLSERASKGPIDRKFGEDRPKYKDAISTAEPWLLVTTKLGRIFYHNPQTGDSLWQLPESIADAVEEWQRTRFDDPLLQHQPMGGESDISQEAEYEPEQIETDPKGANVEFDEDDIAWQLAAMEEEGLMPAEQAAEDKHVFTAAERQELFQVMLSDCEVDPYSTWEAEVEKIAADPRYLVLDSTKLRKAAFDNYCIKEAQRRADDKANIYKKPAKQAFLELVAQHQSKFTYWQDFKRKFKKEEVYRAYGATDHEREKLFRFLHDHLKRSQTQREKDFLALLESATAELPSDPRWHALGADQRQAIEQVFIDRRR